MPASLIVLGLAPGERNIAIFDHVLDLSSHYDLLARKWINIKLLRFCTGSCSSWCAKVELGWYVINLLVNENKIIK